MKFEIESSVRWNDINRKFYMKLYKAFDDVRYLHNYYKALDIAITLRGRHCSHYCSG